MIYDIEETVSPDDVSLDSFKVKNELNPKFWKNRNRIDQKIRKALLIIAKDFIEYCDLGDYEIDDVVITGSIANYNWNKDYSDIDLHIIMDTTEISEDSSIAKNYCTFAKNLWNKNHTDVSVAGYPVEVYIQDSSEPHRSSGVYSLLDDRWLVKPDKKLMKPDYTSAEVKKDSAYFMNKIDELIDRESDGDVDGLYDEACRTMDDIKNVRARSMRSTKKSVELTSGNLIFKTLRRTGYIEKLLDLKNRLINRKLSY